MAKYLKRFLLNKHYILKKSWQITGVIYGVFGLIALLAPTDQILPEDWKISIRIFLSVLILCAVFILVCLVVFWGTIKKEKVEVLRVQKGKKLFVQYGDLFDKKIIQDSKGIPSAEKRNIIIPVNCCFDTIVDDDLIARDKIHGKAIENLLTQMSLDELDAKITRALTDKTFVEIKTEQKRKGNLKRYPFGTVVELDAIDDSRYFLVALTEFNKNLHAEIHNRENYLLVVQRMIEYIESRSQGLPTILPIVGGGLSEVSTSEQTILDMLIQMYKLNIDKINCDIHIVIRENGKDNIRILGY